VDGCGWGGFVLADVVHVSDEKTHPVGATHTSSLLPLRIVFAAVL
jgi:hypothetical protein